MAALGASRGSSATGRRGPRRGGRVPVTTAIALAAFATPAAAKPPVGAPAPVTVVAVLARSGDVDPEAGRAVDDVLRAAAAKAARVRVLTPDDEARIARNLVRRWVVLDDLPPADQCRALGADLCVHASLGRVPNGELSADAQRFIAQAASGERFKCGNDVVVLPASHDDGAAHLGPANVRADVVVFAGPTRTAVAAERIVAVDHAGLLRRIADVAPQLVDAAIAGPAPGGPGTSCVDGATTTGAPTTTAPATTAPATTAPATTAPTTPGTSP